MEPEYYIIVACERDNASPLHHINIDFFISEYSASTNLFFSILIKIYHVIYIQLSNLKVFEIETYFLFIYSFPSKWAATGTYRYINYVIPTR